MSKSRRRWVHDAATPLVAGFDPRGITVRVAPVGRPSEAVSFKIDWWQFRNFLSDVRSASKAQAERLRENAGSVERTVL